MMRHPYGEWKAVERVAGQGGRRQAAHRRSRNEQIATDMRLWLRDELRVLEGYLEDFIKCVIGRSEREIDVLVSIPFSSGS